MKTIVEASVDFRKMAQAMVGDVQKKAALRTSFNALAIIKKRVQREGTKEDGSKFKDYSTTPLPLFFYNGRSRTGSDAANKKLEKVAKGQAKEGQKGYYASYSQWRQANNLQVAHKDFTFSGRMWSNIKPVMSDQKDGIVTVAINAVEDEAKKKLKYVSDRDGAILRLSKEEVALLSDQYTNEFINELSKNLE